ncbi:MAG: MFS transporter, partial [Mesorhizobium sp.]
GILVPPLTGGVMDLIGAAGLPVTLGAICAALAVATVIRRRVM